MHKTLTALAVAATMIVAAVAAPDQADARWRGRHHGGGVAAGIIGGLAAGAILGGLAANQGYYYGPGYTYGPDYGPTYYGSRYYYGPGPFAFEPAPVYVRPVPRAYRSGGCWIVTDSTRGFGYYGPCY